MADYPQFLDLSAIGGGLVWLVLVYVGRLTPITAVIALAMLVLVPIGLVLADTPRRDGTRTRLYVIARYSQPLAAASAVFALILDPGVSATVLSLPWVGFTAVTAGFGAWRLLQRGVWPLSEVALDLGLIYLVVGAGALVFDRLGIALFFEPIIIRLTIVHFLYAGFALPISAGLAGRLPPADPFERLLAATTAVIAVGPGLIAIGITFASLGTTIGKLIEVLAVGAFTTAVALFSLSVLVGVVPRLNGLIQQLLVGVASVIVTTTMVLALAYGFARFTGGQYLGITADSYTRMVRWHGQFNAYGFGLLALLGWRLERPVSRARPPGITFSRLTSGWHVGPDFLQRTGLAAPDDRTGMVDSLDRFVDDAGSIHPDVRWVYEHSEATVLEVTPDWTPIPRRLAPLYRRIVDPLGQLSIPLRSLSGEDALTSEVVGVDGQADGRTGVRAWIRSNDWDGTADSAMTYVAAYADYEGIGGTFSGLAFPLPYCNLSAILRIERLGPSDDEQATGGIILSSYPAEDNGDDAGLYLVVRGYGIRLPINERLRAWSPETPGAPASPFEVADSDDDRIVFVRHDVELLGWRLFSVYYRITEATPGSEDCNSEHEGEAVTT